MTLTPPLGSQRKGSHPSDTKEDYTMTPTIDRRRILIFLAIAYGFSIALGLVIYFNGGLSDSDGVGLSPLAAALLAALMFAPTVANIATRLITREGWSNMMLWPKLRRGWPFYLAGLILPPALLSVASALGLPQLPVASLVPPASEAKRAAATSPH